MSVLLRRHAHRGSVRAVGVVIEPARLGEAEARRRVLAWWEPGCEVRDVEGAWIVRLAAPRRVPVADAPGAPLVVAGDVLAAMPLTPAELSALDAPAGAVVLARGGAVVVVPAGAGVIVEPATWLGIEELALLQASPLAPPPPAVVPVVEVTREVRDVLGIAASTDEANAIRTALRDAGEGTGEGTGIGTGVPAKPSWWSRVVSSTFGRLRDRAARAIHDSRLGAVIGKRHADYLRETLEMFDRGELDEALRRAIPLGGIGGASRPAIGLPEPRTKLEPSMAPPRGDGSAIPVPLRAVDLFRDRYEAARDRLLRDGRIEEAAFVVADLLGDPEAAIALLERHGRPRLAAELAEARGLAPGLVIRQWFVAGEAARAIAVAWRTGAYADALARLRDDAPTATALRHAWAHALADAGDLLGAVTIGHDLPAEVIDAWIARGIAAGGVPAARLWLIRLARDPGAWPEVRAAVLAILDGTADEELGERIAIARGLEAASGEGVALLARAAARTMLAEVGRGVDGEPAVLLPRLVRISGDPALRADLPTLGRLPPRDALVDRDAPWTRRIARSDAGAVAIHDVALLAGGRVAVALGEAGVRLLGRDGRAIARLDQPAEELVVNDHRTQVIAIARRGQVRRLARLDLVSRTAASWCEVPLDGWSSTYDGRLWLVHRGRDLLALDVAAADARASWSVDLDAAGRWHAPVRDGDRWAVLGQEPTGEVEAWSFERFTLRRRAPVPPDPAGKPTVAAAAGADTGAWVLVTRDHAGHELVTADWRQPLAGAVEALVVDGRLAALTSRTDDALTVEVIYLPNRSCVASLVLEGAQRATVRLADLCLLVGDDRGRLVVVDLRSGTVRRDLRLV